MRHAVRARAAAHVGGRHAVGAFTLAGMLKVMRAYRWPGLVWGSVSNAVRTVGCMAWQQVWYNYEVRCNNTYNRAFVQHQVPGVSRNWARLAVI